MKRWIILGWNKINVTLCEVYYQWFHYQRAIPRVLVYSNYWWSNFALLTDTSLSLGLSLNQVRAQCYDGASNMRGRYSGLAARSLEACHIHPLSCSSAESCPSECMLCWERYLKCFGHSILLIIYWRKKQGGWGAVAPPHLQRETTPPIIYV